jgi:hypothetical protein
MLKSAVQLILAKFQELTLKDVSVDLLHVTMVSVMLHGNVIIIALVGQTGLHPLVLLESTKLENVIVYIKSKTAVGVGVGEEHINTPLVRGVKF